MARTISYVFGAILAIVGVWGLVTTPVLGIFDTTTAHSLVHIVTGLVLLAVVAWWPMYNSMVLKIFGVIYAIVAIWGFVIPGEILGIIDNTLVDNILHVVLAVVFLWAGFMGGNKMSMSSSMSSGM